MASRPLELAILRKGRFQTTLLAEADPASPESIRDVLQQWLTANKWDEALWFQFQADVREPGHGKVLARVLARAVG